MAAGSGVGPMTAVAGRTTIALCLVLGAIAGRLIDFRALAGPVKGDEATYIAMAQSLAGDADLLYDRGDYQRFVAANRQIPDGIFLKRAYDIDVNVQAAWPPVDMVYTPEPATERLSYGKALIYPVAVAPFVALGGLGGMLVFNVILLAVCVWCSVKVAQARAGRTAGLVMGVAFIGATVVPIYTVWLTSELFNFTTVLVAYFLWVYKKVAPEPGRLRGGWTDLMAAVLLGVATYSKLTNALLVAPIGLDYLLAARLWPAVRVGVAFGLSTVSLFGATALTSGEWNYQGAAVASDRRTFHSHVPFDDSGTTFDVSGNAMVTNDADTGTVFAPDVLALLPINTWYFLVGRHAGLVPYYFPAVVLAVLALWRFRRLQLWQWKMFGTVAASAGALLIFAPYVWNGGGGPPGNRYFLSLYPTFLALIPVAVSLPAAVVSLAVGAFFTLAIVLRPFQASLEPWTNPDWPPLRVLPIELTIVDDLPVRLHPKRARVLFVRDPTVFLYYFDGATYYAEGAGFWTRGGDRADIVVRTERPVTRFGVTLTSRVANRVTVRFAGRQYDVDLDPGAPMQLWMDPLDQMTVHGSYPYLLQVTSTAAFVPAESEPGSTDDRRLGVFVEPRFYYGAPPTLSGVYAPPPDPGGE